MGYLLGISQSDTYGGDIPQPYVTAVDPDEGIGNGFGGLLTVDSGDIKVFARLVDLACGKDRCHLADRLIDRCFGKPIGIDLLLIKGNEYLLIRISANINTAEILDQGESALEIVSDI